MNFETPEQVIQWADKAARADYERHKPVHVDEKTGENWQWDKNPYSTPGARNDWQKGFEGSPEGSEAEPFNTYYQRGRAMARIVKGA